MGVLGLLPVSFAPGDALQLLSDGGTTPVVVVVVERALGFVFVSWSVSLSKES